MSKKIKESKDLQGVNDICIRALLLVNNDDFCPEQNSEQTDEFFNQMALITDYCSDMETVLAKILYPGNKLKIKGLIEDYLKQQPKGEISQEEFKTEVLIKALSKVREKLGIVVDSTGQKKDFTL